MRFLSDRDDLTIAVVGFGYVGSCIAGTLADRGFTVVGIDADQSLVDELAAGHCRIQEPRLADLLVSGMAAGRLRVTTDTDELARADVILLTVGTPVNEDGSLSDEQLRGASQTVADNLRPGQLVVVKSTVPPGTSRDVVLPILERSGLVGGVDFGLAYTPERLAEGTALKELITFPIVAGGLGPASSAAVARFWRRTLGVRVLPLDSLEAAEIVKLADNWWIDLNIALANELAKLCALHDADVIDVIAAANTIPKGTGNVNILLPSVGVGGSCLTKDPWMVWRSAGDRGVKILTAVAGREVNAGMPEYTARLVIEDLLRLGKDPATATVAVLGLAFKNNTGDLRATPTLGFIEALAESGARIRVHDPLVSPDEIEAVFGITASPTVAEAARDADCVAVLALHNAFHDIDFGALPVAEPCLLLDGRAYYPREKIAELTALGYAYRGIGRGGPDTWESGAGSTTAVAA